jgi:hypothetical protein
MLYRPATEPNLARIALWLENWNVEADRFREGALAARRGDGVSQALVAAAEEAAEGLSAAMDEIDTLLDRLPAGHPQFMTLLAAQNTALSLKESIQTSLEGLDMSAARPLPSPRHTRRPGFYAER